MRDICVVNDVQQYMPAILANGPWIHIATLRSGQTEYIVFRQESTAKLYIEKVVNPITWTLAAIDDESEWNEIFNFCLEAGIFSISGEIKAARNLLINGH